jgi:hypothetical protein
VPHEQDLTEALASEWSETLRRAGEVRVTFDTDEERDLYRSAGRKAGRLLKRRVRTVVNGRRVLIVLDDWMDNPLQARVEDNRARKALDLAFSEDATQPPPVPSRPVLRSVPLPHDNSAD